MELTAKIRAVATALLPHTTADPYASGASMRALDGLIRSRVSESLAQAAAVARSAYSHGYEALGHPTRDHPLPDLEAMRQWNRLKRLSEELSGLGALVSALPAPTNDRVWQRLRNNRTLLELLIEYDYNLVEYSKTLEAAVRGVDETVAPQDLEASLDPIRKLLRERSDLLSAVP